jgi:phosphatidylserine/phosphatidylglycerophosphate/cardiolipin synthase-like enzyme
MRVRTYANCDRMYVVWTIERRIEGLRGFALYRKRNGDESEAIDTFVGFQDETVAPGTHKPSTEWPIQKFMWADFFVNLGDRVSYQVVPMTGSSGNLTPASDAASEWTEELTVTAAADDGFDVYFNRGIVASQWLARRLTDPNKHRQLRRIIETPGDDTRNDLSDPLRTAMIELLAEVGDDGSYVYAALFELNDPELIPCLERLGRRAHVVLGNGSPKKADEDPNEDARAALRQAGVYVYDRMLRSGHLPHNKFMVIEKARKPNKVWTGSTNWSMTGLCTQANNGILISSPSVARDYKMYWDALKQAASNFPADTPKQAPPRTLRGTRVTSRFTPVPEMVDIAEATELINAAEQGILFTMFNPGPVGTLFNAIVERASPASAHYDPELYIHGVMNQDPGTEKHPVDPVVFLHRGHFESAGFDVIQPGYVNEAFAHWSEEIKKLSGTFAMVHSKCVVLDPFGERPVVMTGSHNLGPKASSSNDDNMVIIEGTTGVATAYAVSIMGIYNDYRWRFRLSQREQKSPGSWRWGGLEDNDTWQDDYLGGQEKQKEIAFWLGKPDAIR